MLIVHVWYECMHMLYICGEFRCICVCVVHTHVCMYVYICGLWICGVCMLVYVCVHMCMGLYVCGMRECVVYICGMGEYEHICMPVERPKVNADIHSQLYSHLIH